MRPEIPGAFQFGATNLAPFDFTNPAVQAFQWSA